MAIQPSCTTSAAASSHSVSLRAWRSNLGCQRRIKTRTASESPLCARSTNNSFKMSSASLGSWRHYFSNTTVRSCQSCGGWQKAKKLKKELARTEVIYLPVGRSHAPAAGWGSIAIDRREFLGTGLASPTLKGRLSQRASNDARLCTRLYSCSALRHALGCLDVCQPSIQNGKSWREFMLESPNPALSQWEREQEN
jgi:hypothetical protein